MHTYTAIPLMVSFLCCAGCAQSPTTAGRSAATAKTSDRVVYTGSRIPQPRNRVTLDPLSATTPVDSFSRHPDSLVPTEPVVGATNNAGPADDTGPSTNTLEAAGSR